MTDKSLNLGYNSTKITQNRYFNILELWQNEVVLSHSSVLIKNTGSYQGKGRKYDKFQEISRKCIKM